MDLVSDTLSYYDLTEPTKCLNTAVVVTTLYLGTKALDYTKSCDVPTVIARHNEMISRTKKRNSDTAFDPTIFYLRNLTKSLFSNDDKRWLYYIMITDADISKSSNASSSQGTVLFPGHVFVIEKVHKTQFFIYQSYINHYDLNGHYEQNTNSFKISKRVLQNVFKELDLMFTNGNWTQATTKAWKTLTHVNSPEFEGLRFKDNVHVCYRQVELQTCTDTLKQLISQKLSKKEGGNTRRNRLLELNSQVMAYT